MKHSARGLQAAIGLKMQRMNSVEADFNALTWTFSAPSFTVTGGEYLIIPKDDWDEFWDKLAAESET